MNYELPFRYWDLFLQGIVTTLTLTFIALAVGFLIAMPCALSMWRKGPMSKFAYSFAYFFRGTPLLVQAYLIYYGLSQFEFVRNSGPLWDYVFRDAWMCALIAFSLNSAAYQAEILRGAFATTPKGELEAADALGLSAKQKTWLILLPSSFRRALPQYSNEVVFMLHSSVVASVITIQDILGVGRTINAKHYVAYEGFISAAVVYMALTFTLLFFMRKIEKHIMRHNRPPENSGDDDDSSGGLKGIGTAIFKRNAGTA